VEARGVELLVGEYVNFYRGKKWPLFTRLSR